MGDLCRTPETYVTERRDIRAEMAQAAAEAAKRIRERERQLAISLSPQREEWPN